MDASIRKIPEIMVQQARHNSSNVSFNGNLHGSDLKKVMNIAKDEIIKSQPRKIAFFNFLGKHNGDILNTTINAVGTAFVAPLFIANNPLSKEDKETKLYSAWRQPISAVLSVITQVGVNLKSNKYIDKIIQEGKLGDKFNLNKLPGEAEEAFKTRIAGTKIRIKSLKGVVGLALSLMTLPISCSILNWVYPRFMEKVFPNLCNAKQTKTETK